MPVDKSRYPANWKKISQHIKDRAGNRCEQCGVANGAYIMRSRIDGARYVVLDEATLGYCYPDGTLLRMSEIPEEYLSDKPDTRVVLTVHHIGIDGDSHDKMDCRDENLVALCQRCHLIADLPIHIANSRKTRLEKKRQQVIDAGQKELF